MRQACLAIAALVLWLGCAAPTPGNLGIHDGHLSPCPPSPNCVSTASTGSHGTAPFRLAKPAAEAWQDARQAVLSLPRTRIVEENETYLHAESTTPLLRFVDDIELQLQPHERRIAVRSASRTGWSDLGVNRERVWELRRALKARGAIY